MSPHLHAEMMSLRTAEVARNAERHDEAPRRARGHKPARAVRTHRCFPLLRLPRRAAA